MYVFLGRDGETLYVGKARVLRDRVRNYLAAEGTSPRHDALLRDASALDVIVTDSVVEALALENRLIKQRNPRFNVLLRDDKTYPYLQLTTTERAPRLLVARRVERDGNVYAGPFMPAVGGAPDHAGWRIGCSASDRATRSSTANATGRAWSTTSSAAWRRASTTICSIERVRPRGRPGAAA